MFSQISDFNFLVAQNYMLGAKECQIRGKESQREIYVAPASRRRHEKPAFVAAIESC
jgi:hypothetical protein